MNGFGKFQNSRDICKNHSARSDKEGSQICPSKLSKRELEDLYFGLLENNLELKRTINNQRDKMKILSTKVQRMTTAQRNNMGKEDENCCLATRAVVNEQQETLAELKKKNECLTERIHQLNMRLCSAKQFIKRSPPQNNIRCPKCVPITPSTKNSSVTVLTNRKSETKTSEAFTQFYDKEGISTRTVETETDLEKNDAAPCNENKCRTLMDELKQKITDLQQELTVTHDEYSDRISRLEGEMLGLREENTRVRAERASDLSDLTQRRQENDQMGCRLRDAESKYSELAMQLAIERSKVAELETRVKATDMSSNIAKTIENHLNNVKGQNAVTDGKASPKPNNKSVLSPDNRRDRYSKDAELDPVAAGTSKLEEVNCTRYSDDSGYTDANKSQEYDDKGSPKINDELTKKIEDLQTQLDALKISAMPKLNIKRRETEAKSPDIVGQVLKRDKSHDKDTADTPVTENALRVEDRTSSSSYRSGHKKDIKTAKSDSHNSLQVPGPFPADLTKYNKNGVRTKPSKSTKDEEQFIRNSVCRSCDESKENSIKEFNKNDIKKHSSIKINDDKVKQEIDVQNAKTSQDIKCNEQNCFAHFREMEDSTEHKNSEIKPAKMKKVICECKKKVNCQTAVWSNEAVNDQDILMPTDPPKTVIESIEKGNDVNKKPTAAVEAVAEKQRIVEKITPAKEEDALVVCERHAVMCSCPAAKRRGVSVFRSCSGTLRFATAALSDRNLRHCDCVSRQLQRIRQALDSEGNDKDNKEERLEKQKGPESPPRTYSLPGGKCSRATSPDNTDREISTLTDLPSEREDTDRSCPAGKSGRRLSPGEEKLSVSYSETPTQYSRTNTNESLSEGEVPAERIRTRTLSIGETQVIENVPEPEMCDQAPNRNTSTSQRVQLALDAIAEELARCRQLLLTQRPREPEKQQSDATTMTSLPDSTISLRHSKGQPHISGSHTPYCIFTLHFGTLVLSDEAILKSRDRTLVLMWQFYDQHNMTHMHHGRVVHYDFSTEYDVKMSNEFLNYMKFDEMPITICELQNRHEPFATCSLPLRDALLHTNRRVDLSLALMAGPQMVPQEHGSGSLEGHETFGVLDLWCVLRADPGLMPDISNVVGHPIMSLRGSSDDKTRPHIPGSRSDLDVLNDIAKNDIDDNERRWQSRSRDINYTKNTASVLRDSSMGTQKTSLVEAETQTHLQPILTHREIPYSPSLMQHDARSVSHTPVVSPENRRDPIFGKRDSRDSNYHYPAESNRMYRPSEMIMNEVSASVRTTSEMKHALDRNPSARIPFREEPNINITPPKRDSDGSSSFYEKLKQRNWRNSRKSSQKKDTPLTLRDGREENDYSQIKSQDSFLSTRLMDNPKKSVTIQPDYRTVYQEQPSKQRETEVSRVSELSNKCRTQTLDITVLWLSLNERCEAMAEASVQRLYVAYRFLGRGGADLETPHSVPKPKTYLDKCYFNFTKTFHLTDYDLSILCDMVKYRSSDEISPGPKTCVVFTIISEPPEDPLGLQNCRDIGYAYLYFGDVVTYAGTSEAYTEMLPVQAAGAAGLVCGVLAVRVGGLPVLRRGARLAAGLHDYR